MRQGAHFRILFSPPVLSRLSTPTKCSTDSTCTWCVSKTIPSECVAKADAAHLPPAVFACGKDVQPKAAREASLERFVAALLPMKAFAPASTTGAAANCTDVYKMSAATATAPAECGQTCLAPKLAGFAVRFGHLTQGTCAAIGYTKYVRTQTKKVPIIGSFTVTIYAKPSGAGALRAGARQQPARRPSEVWTREVELAAGIVHERSVSPRPQDTLDAADMPDAFTWCDKDGVNYCTASLNQHIPQ